MKTIYLGVIFFSLHLLVACSSDSPTSPDTEEPPLDTVVSSVTLELEPSGFAPLTAVLTLETSQNVLPEITVVGKNGEASNVTLVIEESNTQFSIDVLGLYPDFNNEVVLTLRDSNQQLIETRTLNIQTEELNINLPTISIDVAPSTTELMLHFVNYFGFQFSFRPQRPFIFDQFGDIRWYLDYSQHPTFSTLFYDNGMQRLANGNLFFGDGSTGSIYEIDMAGRILNTWSLQGNGFHHHVIEKPDGNFIVTINDASKMTIEDVVVEIDRTTSEIVTTWDLNDSLDNSRRGWPTTRADLNIDWFHANALEYSEIDDEIIVSGRTQGIVKLNQNNEVSYILAPHREWNLSGIGVDLSQFLLTPLDADNQAIEDPLVLYGSINHPDFEWSWYQHSPILMPNSNLMVFDNGDNRNYVGFGPYSRAVEYEIDEAAMTIKQVWSYGRDRGEETYSEIVSKVSYLAQSNTVLFTPGASVSSGQPTGKVIEIDYDTKQVVFEASIVPPSSVANISFHNVLRIDSLY